MLSCRFDERPLELFEAASCAAPPTPVQTRSRRGGGHRAPRARMTTTFQPRLPRGQRSRPGCHEPGAEADSEHHDRESTRRAGRRLEQRQRDRFQRDRLGWEYLHGSPALQGVREDRGERVECTHHRRRWHAADRHVKPTAKADVGAVVSEYSGSQPPPERRPSIRRIPRPAPWARPPRWRRVRRRPRQAPANWPSVCTSIPDSATP
jgi:hypothetical protein